MPPVEWFSLNWMKLEKAVARNSGMEILQEIIQFFYDSLQGKDKKPKTLAEEAAHKFQKAAGCSKDKSPVKCLRGKSVQKLQKAMNKLARKLGYFGYFAFQPVGGPGSSRVGPAQQLLSGKVVGKRLLVGVCGHLHPHSRHCTDRL